ncbi:hypothetical protein IRZ71_21495 [Flavobacterium sp. ANB]|uniref:tetratricopeptide repeat protein n=1 Tax=unclassified Flavobacterium TaxID=196869 RepID=UPI0012B6D5B6|nr:MULTISPECIES: tetratricopeptide repeat protein [unclassified Flavobacterium]MBF4518939.1 hypothetical protein [Flavobacterium sp. ANB]MTD71549.1 hypothetical protein [Flavobacterium sp. LC2016-13]
MLEQIIDVFDVNTDAVATNKGFYYQYLTILKKWITNFIEDNDIEAYSEVDQDIKEVGENLVFTQVKCYTSTFSLASEEVKSTIFNFFLLYLKNKNLFAEPKFCFATNTKVAVREKLLIQWIDDESLNDSKLKKICINKIREILSKEIKIRKNKKLSQKISVEKSSLIKSSSEALNLIIEDEVANFTQKIQWKFESLSPDEAIKKIKSEIELLLTNEKFNNKPISILFGVLISEIFRCSQNKDVAKRKLTKEMISDLLERSDNELQNYQNDKFFRLINIDIEIIRSNIENIQSKIDYHDFRINTLEKSSVESKAIKFPKFLNQIPDYNFTNFLDWDIFMDEVHSELNISGMVSVYGPGGMGKTSFAKKYLKTHSEYDHIVWITVEKSIDYSFVFDEVLSKNLNIAFLEQDEIEQRFNIMLNALNNVKGRKLIIIDIQKIDYDKSSFNLLSTLTSWRILVLTRNHIKTARSKKLPHIDLENAKSIFRSHLKKEAVDDNKLEEFIKYIDYNLLVIELTAKTIENSFDLNLSQFISSLKEQNLNGNEFKVEIDVAGENNSIEIFNYLLQKFSINNLESFEANYLDFLALLPASDIVIDDLILINGKDYYDQNKTPIMNALISLDKKGLVELSSDKKRLTIHKIIQEVIIYKQREGNSPFVHNIFYISFLTARIKEGQNNPAISYKYLRYAQSILDNIKGRFRTAVYQPLILLENELLYTYRFFIQLENELDRWIDLAARAEIYPMLDKSNLGIIYNNLGLAYAKTDNDKALETFQKGIDLFYQNEILHQQSIITAFNNISNVLLMKKDIAGAVANFKKAQNFRKKYNLQDDQQTVIEYRTLAQTYRIVGKIDKSIEIMSTGIAIHCSLKSEAKNDFILSACYNYLSELYLLNNNLEMGLINQEKAVQIMEGMGIHNSGYLLLMYEILIHLYRSLGVSAKEEIVKRKIEEFKAFKA